MSEKSKPRLRNEIVAPKTYVSVLIGYSLTLPTGVEFNNGLTRVRFDSNKGKEFTTDELEIQEYLEGLGKFGEPGQPGRIKGVKVQYYYCPTAEEIAEALAKEKAAEHLAFIKANPAFKLDLKELTYPQLTELAEKFNIAIVTEKNTKRAGKDVAADIEDLFADVEDSEDEVE